MLCGRSLELRLLALSAQQAKFVWKEPAPARASGTAEILVGLQASRSAPGLHTIHSARSPCEQYSLGAFNSSHLITLGLFRPSVKSEKSQMDYDSCGDRPGPTGPIELTGHLSIGLGTVGPSTANKA